MHQNILDFGTNRFKTLYYVCHKGQEEREECAHRNKKKSSINELFGKLSMFPWDKTQKKKNRKHIMKINDGLTKI